MSKTNSAITVQIVDLLEPLASDDRKRIIKAALVLLAEEEVSQNPSPPEQVYEGEGDFPLSQKGKVWARQNKISSEQLLQVFHPNDGALEIIVGEVSGKANKDKVRKAYLLMGLVDYLQTGTGNFEDKAARSFCEKLGCYDSTNHSKALKFGNELTGDANKGWTITGPGLKQAAVLVAQLSSDDD